MTSQGCHLQRRAARHCNDFAVLNSLASTAFTVLALQEYLLLSPNIPAVYRHLELRWVPPTCRGILWPCSACREASLQALQSQQSLQNRQDGVAAPLQEISVNVVSQPHPGGRRQSSGMAPVTSHRLECPHAMRVLHTHLNGSMAYSGKACWHLGSPGAGCASRCACQALLPKCLMFMPV